MKNAHLEFETTFNGRQLKTSAAIKASYVEINQLPSNKTELLGIDIEALNTICAQLNLTPAIEIVGRGSDYLDNLNGTLLSLDNGKISLYLNRYFSSLEINDYLLPVSLDSLYFIMQDRPIRNQYWRILSGFQKMVWAAVCVTFVAVAVLWRYVFTGSQPTT